MNDIKKTVQVFVSHTQKDKIFCDKFDIACARVGVKAFRSELENISAPPYVTIKNAMNNSIALFFLVGKELVKNQEKSDQGWAYTQNWIAYEIGLACQLGIDVWAICDDVMINFPMPFINNYLTISLAQKKSFNFMRYVLSEYNQGRTFSYPYTSTKGFSHGVICPHSDCRMEFNLQVTYQKGYKITCPQCLRMISFPNNHPALDS